MSLITIDQLLESVDLDFEPRWVTKDDEGDIRIWEKNPVFTEGKFINHWAGSGKYHTLEKINVVEFYGKDWTECIYEVPRKTTGKIEKLGRLNVSGTNMTMNQSVVDRVVNVLNQVIDVVNELKGAKNE